MVKLIDRLKIISYSMFLSLALGCGSPNGTDNGTDPCLDEAREKAQSSTLMGFDRLEDLDDYCEAYVHDVIFELQGCLEKRDNLSYSCITVQNYRFVDKPGFALRCVQNVEQEKPLDRGIEYWCASFDRID